MSQTSEPKKWTWSDVGIYAFIILTVGAIPFGIAMALWTNEPNWLMLCGFLLLYLS